MTPFYMATAPQGYQPRWSPAPRRQVAHFVGSPARLGQDYAGMSVLAAGLFGIGASAALAYTGIYTGTHAKGWLAVGVGWVVGVIGILSGLGVILTLAGVGLLAAAA